MATWNELFMDEKFIAALPQPEVYKFVKVLEGIFTDRPLSIWDFCCGAGRHTVLISQMGHNAYGSDISENGIKHTLRGKKILNDATMEDARMIGLTEIADVIDNGTEIAGTCLELIDIKAKECIEAADVIISKGQGNFETLNGCGLNIYYLFLCKCEWFVKRFGMEQFKGVFINDKNCFL